MARAAGRSLDTGVHMLPGSGREQEEENAMTQTQHGWRESFPLEATAQASCLQTENSVGCGAASPGLLYPGHYVRASTQGQEWFREASET